MKTIKDIVRYIRTGVHPAVEFSAEIGSRANASLAGVSARAVDVAPSTDGRIHVVFEFGQGDTTSKSAQCLMTVPFSPDEPFESVMQLVETPQQLFRQYCALHPMPRHGWF